MLKNVLIVSIIGLASSSLYAEEKSVTESYLLGSWNCINVHLSASSNGDDNFNYDYKFTDDPIIVTFLKSEDYEDYQPEDGDRKAVSSQEYIKTYKSNPTYNKDTQDENYNTMEHGYLYVNDNEFIYYQYSAIFWKYKFKSYGHKQDMACKRMN